MNLLLLLVQYQAPQNIVKMLIIKSMEKNHAFSFAMDIEKYECIRPTLSIKVVLQI